MTNNAINATNVNHNILVGTGVGYTSISPSATSGVPLISQGASSDPAYGTAVVAGGGTGAVTLTGVLTGNGTSAVTASTVTNHGVIIGAASNAVSSTAVGSTGQVLQANSSADPSYSTATYPSSTTINRILYSSATNVVGQITTANNGALITNGSGVPSIGTVPIAAGGTNATSMSTNTGIVKFDGTSLVTSTTAKIDSSNRYTNTSQPAVQAQVNAVVVNNVTGDGTTYTVIFDNVQFDQNSNYNNATGIFTAPVTGRYLFGANVTMFGIIVTNTNVLLNLNQVGKTNQLSNFNPFPIVNGNTEVTIHASTMVGMTAGDTFKVTIRVDGNGTPNVGIAGDSSGAYSYFYAALLC